MDGLIQNAGSRFQRTFADEPLLERLRLLARDEVVDAQVRKKAKVLFVQWASEYKKTPGLERIASLYQELPKSQRPQAARQKVLREGQAELDSEPSPSSPRPQTRTPSNSVSMPSSSPLSSQRPITLSSPSSNFSAKLSKMKKDRQGKPFSLSKEKENMTTCIANSSIASTNLLNGLQLINRESERVSENKEVLRRFELCKSLRREILRYIQHVESDDWIGSLVNANDELVKALTAFEIMDKSVSDDSDSDAWENIDPKTRNSRAPSQSAVTSGIAGLTLDNQQHKPPRPNAVPVPPASSFNKRSSVDEEGEGDDDDDEDNPFGDRNATSTPSAELTGMRWREV